jgi:hypothetical protein
VAAPSGSWLGDFEQSVQQADPAWVGLIVLALALGALVCGALAFRYLYRARLIEDTPTSRARSAHQGYVELEGRAQRMDHSPVTALLSGLPCCWYRYKIEELEVSRSDKGTHTRWKVIARGESKDTFWLEDDTGRVAIDPEGAEIYPRYKDSWQSRSGLSGIARPSEFFVGFFATHSSATTYRFTEERINRNDLIYALGLLKNLGAHVNTPTIDDRAKELLRDWKQDQAELHERFDLNKDGKIDEKEWLLARQAARREAAGATSLSRGPRLDSGMESRAMPQGCGDYGFGPIGEAAGATSLSRGPRLGPIGEAERVHAAQLQQTVEGINLLTRPADSRRPYILSAFPQKELVARKKRWMLLCATGFFASGIVALWLFNTRFR